MYVFCYWRGTEQNIFHVAQIEYAIGYQVMRHSNRIQIMNPLFASRMLESIAVI